MNSRLVRINRPVIIEKKEPPEDADNWRDVENKFEKYFSEKKGE